MENITENLALIIPIFIVELALAITALVHVIKHPNYKFGTKIMWILIVLCIQIIGPVVYFILGRGEEE